MTKKQWGEMSLFVISVNIKIATTILFAIWHWEYIKAVTIDTIMLRIR